MNKTDMQLTTTEEELMLILWGIKKGSVKDIMEELSKTRDLAYTSVSTIIRILEKKGFVASTKKGRGHIYQPLIEKEKYQKSKVDLLVNNVFKEAPVSIVKCLIEDNKLSAKDLIELRSLLEDKQ